jgi:salicylate hydroxylase
LVRAYETIRRGRSKFLHEVEVTTVKQAMFPPGPGREARDLEMQKLLRTGQDKWDDDTFLGMYGQHCKIWAYNAFDAADDWWVQWGALREQALCLQDPDVEVPFSRLEISISKGT